jgi:photosystem II stability/assembly factor-like uncharacterized protein
MNIKTSAAYLSVIIVVLLCAFRAHGVKENERKASQNVVPSKPKATELRIENGRLVCAEATPGPASNIIFQSRDGGTTWEDISYSLPDNQQPENFFVAGSELYLRVNNELYRSSANLKTPVWEKDNKLDPRCNAIAFNQSRVLAFNYDGQIIQKNSAGEWFAVYTNFKKPSLQNVFEAEDGSIFLGSGDGLFKSSDKGASWKQVYKECWVGDLVESEGVLLGAGRGGIMRSADNGETWEWVISEGGVGIAIERITGGFAAITYNTTTKTRRIRISMDGGKTWNAIDQGLQPSLSVSSIKQFGKYLLVGHPDGIFRTSDMGKTWYKVHGSVDDEFIKTGTLWKVGPSRDAGKVYQIFVSGNTLYAVAKNSGC